VAARWGPGFVSLPTMAVITVATWNMNHQVKSWTHLDQLREQHGVQVALLQEAVPPSDSGRWPGITPDPIAPGWSIRGSKDMKYKWSSAIALLDDQLSFTPVLPTPLAEADYKTFAASHPGQFAVARVRLPEASEELVLISLYGVWHKPSGNGAEATLHRAISDLTPLFLANPHIVLAGDLNLFRNTDNVGQRHFDTVFTRLDAYGLQLHGPFRVAGEPAQRDCTCGQGNRCDHVETFRIWHRNAKPYQDDYVFASESLKLHSCKALIDPAVTDFSDRQQRISDHWPVIATLELS
jgi:endonuclease/exonuclease/phosphatase family metal-dependent hydrolase